MIDERTEELASLHVLGLLEADEARSFETALRADAELAKLVAELESSTASLAHALPPQPPPAHLKNRILSELRGDKKIVALPKSGNWLPWAIAACLALFAGTVTIDRARLQRENTDLRQRDALSQIQIATLNSMIENAPKGVAVVVWDAEKQRGILRVENMPAPRADQDYQLWVFDPKYKLPVNGGVFHFEENGVAKVSFQPDQQVDTANKFAISLERKGGAPQHEGPIVMISK